MPKEFTQFGERVINSFNNKINHSLLWLTIFYTTIIVILLLISSSITFSTFNSQINHRFRSLPIKGERMIISPTAKDVSKDLVEALIVVNGVLILLSAILSYLLAKNTLKPIEESYENQQRFLSNTSHELRTPLSILFANLENLISDESISPKEKENAISNLEEVQRMNKIINDLLILSKFDENKSEPSIDNINLIELLDNIIKRLQIMSDTNQISMVFKSEAKEIFLKSDRDLLTYAISNIIKNALNYNKPGGQVEIEIKENKREVEIKISDTGIGIAQKHLNKIFDRFYRADKSRSRQTGGSGLGLSITKEAVDKLDGWIKIESSEQSGTVVTLKFSKI